MSSLCKTLGSVPSTMEREREHEGKRREKKGRWKEGKREREELRKLR